MKYCRIFEAESNYTDFVNGSDYVTPNLCVIRSTGGTKCKPPHNQTFSTTLEYGQCYPDLVRYLENKYGFGFGSKRQPIAIEEDIFIGDSFSIHHVGTGQVKFLHISNTPSTVGILLYLEDCKETYYCVSLSNQLNNYYGLTSKYFWD